MFKRNNTSPSPSASARAFILLILLSCGNPLPTISGIDLSLWKSDKKGCNGFRHGLIAELKAQKNKLQGLSETELISLLGRPDRQELYKSHQKFYYYSLEPGKTCGALSDGKRLSVRFNATGAAKEIAVE